MRYLMLYCLFMCSISLNAQVTFQAGYIVNNENDTINCFIRDAGWKNSPIEFKFKRTENAQIETGQLQDFQSFAVPGIFLYRRYTVNVDISSNNFNQLSKVMSPEFEERTVYLKVLIEGAASLYGYKAEQLERYFYATAEKPIEQLVYKRYEASYTSIGENTAFRQQLKNDLQCETIKPNRLDNLSYGELALMKVFIQYNQCKDGTFENYNENRQKDKINIRLRPGIGLGSLTLANNAFPIERDIDFGSSIEFRIGLEVEYVFPSNNRKWAFLIEPNFRFYSKTGEIVDRFPQNSSVSYQSIELPMGFRYYIFLNEQSRLFINPLIYFDFALNSDIDFEVSEDLDISSNINVGLGLGYSFSDKVHTELRYTFNREILSEYLFWNTNYSNLSLIFGYTLN